MTRPPRMHEDMNTVTGSRGGGGGDASHVPLPIQPAHTQQAYAPHYTQGTSSFQYSTEPHRANPIPIPPGPMSMSMSASPYAHDGSGNGGSKIQGQGQGQQAYRGPIPTATAAALPYTQSTTYHNVQPPRSYVEAKSPYGNITTTTANAVYNTIQSRIDTGSSSSSSDTEMRMNKDIGDPLQYMS